jgi:hypothetical protein
MSKAVPGDPQIDVDVKLLIEGLNKLDDRKVVNNLDFETLNLLAEACGRVGATANRYLHIRHKQAYGGKLERPGA